MAKFSVSDQNKIMMFFESGTYASPVATSRWIGLVTNHDPSENLNITPLRYVSAAGRNVNQFVATAEDYDGSLTYHPQDWQFLKLALGSCCDGGSPSPYQHNISEHDSNDSCPEILDQPLTSFSIQDSHATTTGSNFVRTVKGCMVDSLTINAPEAGMISVDVSYTAQQCIYSSGAATAVTARTCRPFLSSDAKLLIGSPSITGDPWINVKDWSLVIENSDSKHHYANGVSYRGVPLPTSRNYTLTVNATEYDAYTKQLYDQYYRGGSEFNSEIRLNTANASLGSALLYLSGCRIVSMSDPTITEGENAVAITIRPQTMSAEVYDDIQFYNNTSGVGF